MLARPPPESSGPRRAAGSSGTAGPGGQVWPTQRPGARLAARLSDRLPVVVAWGPGEERLYRRDIAADAVDDAVVARRPSSRWSFFRPRGA